MTWSVAALAVAAVAAAPHLGLAGSPASLVGVTVALLRDRARYVGARLRTNASSAS